ncbi:MAG: HAD family hydrolase [Bacteroidota bacterium]|nr:HAD family hydrolase [Bacteroidota bacterium]
MQKPDSLIFDMDGTLWDAVDTYAESWNLVFNELGIDITVLREQVLKMVGMEASKVTSRVMPDFDDEKRRDVYKIVNEKRRELLPVKGGVLYPGVKEGLKKLAEKYKLFIVSNCDKGIIPLFIEWAGINEYITDELAHGVNLMPKNHNINLLAEKHGLKTPVYIGDTTGDGQESRKAGIPFVFVSYGFGETEDYDLKFDDFDSLTDYFMELI